MLSTTGIIIIVTGVILVLAAIIWFFVRLLTKKRIHIILTILVGVVGLILISTGSFI